ncbi:pyruvate kinase [Tannockella kyphosi]|uniref:pyruvate kinase n=1 Tax=Tannockella kyphosi TaxID=2899121 RepID=UPI0020134204|nr:pyruvate kinase [Tannockella kyphosi]
MKRFDNKSRTKIVCTIGPASESMDMLRKLTKAGMNVMRLNFSHGSQETHLVKMDRILELNEELGSDVSILLDTKGPEIRTGDFVDGKTTFKKGQVCTICIEDIVGTSERFTITYKNLFNDVHPGTFILVNDGQIELLVDHVEGTDIVCVSANEGEVKDKRGINVPGIKLGFNYLSKKDISDIEFGCQHPITYIAASFVRRAQDVFDVKKILIEQQRTDVQIIAKIENKEGVENIDEILEVSDGIMVARGDLGVEVPAEDVPLIQKSLIRKCKEAGKVVITATQMLESMQENPRPTRAEVSDVANAIYDGTDAIMLSGESASGKYPQEAVFMMNKIALKTEQTFDFISLHQQAMKNAGDTPAEAICMSVAEIAAKFKVSAIIAFTETGTTAKKMSRYRPEAMIIAATPFQSTVRQLSLNWGVKGVICKPLDSRSVMIDYASIIAREQGISNGELILVTGGTPGLQGDTSYLELVKVK